MHKNTVVEFARRDEKSDPLSELLRQSARELIQQAVEAELAAFLDEYRDRRLEDGRAAVLEGLKGHGMNAALAIRHRVHFGPPATCRAPYLDRELE